LWAEDEGPDNDLGIFGSDAGAAAPRAARDIWACGTCHVALYQPTKLLIAHTIKVRRTYHNLSKSTGSQLCVDFIMSFFVETGRLREELFFEC
jgi:hypothetical protein